MAHVLLPTYVYLSTEILSIIIGINAFLVFVFWVLLTYGYLLMLMNVYLPTEILGAMLISWVPLTYVSLPTEILGIIMGI